MFISLTTPQEVQKKIAVKVRAKRLASNLSQRTLSERSGVSCSVLKKFERTGQISLESLLKLAFALRCIERFHDLFELNSHENMLSLDELMQEDSTRKRGRE